MDYVVPPNSPETVHNTSDDEYNDTFRQFLKDREEFRGLFENKSEQLAYRSSLVNFQRYCCIENNLNSSCLQLGVYLLDVYMDNNTILQEDLYLVASVCLTLAAKYEDLTYNVPRSADLNRLHGKEYTNRQYCDMEVSVLRYFNFKVNFPTPAHYAALYSHQSLGPNDFSTGVNMETTFIDMKMLIKHFLNIVVDDIHFMQNYKPSLLASAMIASSRINLKLEPWTPELENVTGYSISQLHNAIRDLSKE